MDAELTTAFSLVHQKVEDSFDKLAKKIEKSNDELHEMKLGMQKVTSDLILCQRVMDPRVDALEMKARISSSRTWDIVKPIITRAAEVFALGTIFLIGYYLKKKMGF